MARQLARRTWKGGSRFEPPLYELSEDDKWCRETAQRIAKACGRWLREANKLDILVRRLTDRDMEALAYEAMHEYTKARCERYDEELKREQQPIPPDALDRLLNG